MILHNPKYSTENPKINLFEFPNYEMYSFSISVLKILKNSKRIQKEIFFMSSLNFFQTQKEKSFHIL